MKGEINEAEETFRNFITNFPANNLQNLQRSIKTIVAKVNR